MIQRVIVLRGAPASGKSTIAKNYRNFEEKFVWLKVDAFKDFFAEDATPALEYVNGVAIATLEYLLDKRFSVVFEGVMQNPRVMEEAFSATVSRGIPCHLFELTTPLEVLKQRDKEREGVKEGIRPALREEVIEGLYTIIKETPRKDAIKLDTNKHSLEECIEIIDKSFEGWGKDKKKPFSQGTVCFFVKDDKILLGLITYKPGLQKYSGFGGHVDEGETPEEAIIREIQEEADVRVAKEDLKKVVVLTTTTKFPSENRQSVFEFIVYLTRKWDGEPKDLPGMKLQWFRFEDIPYKQMWEGNDEWLPKILEQKYIKSTAILEKNSENGTEKVISKTIEEVESFG